MHILRTRTEKASQRDTLYTHLTGTVAPPSHKKSQAPILRSRGITTRKSRPPMQSPHAGAACLAPQATFKSAVALTVVTSQRSLPGNIYHVARAARRSQSHTGWDKSSISSLLWSIQWRIWGRLYLRVIIFLLMPVYCHIKTFTHRGRHFVFI